MKLTEEISRSIAQDAGNRSMRDAGRTAWSREDFNAAVAEFARLETLREQTRPFPGIYRTAR